MLQNCITNMWSQDEPPPVVKKGWDELMNEIKEEEKQKRSKI